MTLTGRWRGGAQRAAAAGLNFPLPTNPLYLSIFYYPQVIFPVKFILQVLYFLGFVLGIVENGLCACLACPGTGRAPLSCDQSSNLASLASLPCFTLFPLLQCVSSSFSSCIWCSLALERSLICLNTVTMLVEEAWRFYNLEVLDHLPCFAIFYPILLPYLHYIHLLPVLLACFVALFS